MKKFLPNYLEYFKQVAEEVFKCDSPTGYTDNVINLVKAYIDSYGYESKILNNGALEVSIKGMDASKVVATSAHCDTLGLMVRSIKPNGKLALTLLGGPSTPTLDGEYCTIYTRDGKKYTGTILSTSPAVHVFKDANTKLTVESTFTIDDDVELPTVDLTGYTKKSSLGNNSPSVGM